MAIKVLCLPQFQIGIMQLLKGKFNVFSPTETKLYGLNPKID
jgi:hypothetical protein